MLKCSVTIIMIFVAQISLAQNKNCDCPKKGYNDSGKADKMFSFKNKMTIGLCGFMEQKGADTIYSEFVLFHCEQEKILKDWDATQSCKISKKRDTLIVQELYGLAIDKYLAIKWIPFYITKYYFVNSKLHSTSFFRNDLPKYTTKQIETVITQYRLVTKQSDADSILLIAHRLFWAYVSGSKEAANHLNSFETRFGPFDGAVAEEFHDLWATYQLHKP
jgi:hypothetical protein